MEMQERRRVRMRKARGHEELNAGVVQRYLNQANQQPQTRGQTLKL